MSDKRLEDELTVEELERMLYRKKREQRRQRLYRMKQEGRLIDVAGLPAANPTPPPLARSLAAPTGAMRRYLLDDGNGRSGVALTAETEIPTGRAIRWRWIVNTLLLLVEITAVGGLLVMALLAWDANRALNSEIAEVQQQSVITIALPTATPLPIIDVVLLPGGHKAPVEGRPPEQGEEGNIPAHLLPYLNAYVPPPIPTPGPQQARRIEIPAIEVDSTIVQGTDWEQLKKGVGQQIGSAVPGATGNLVLAAHNDIFGEIFRHLDQLAPGDEIVISSERQSYTYVVSEIRVVEPTDVEVMAATDYASITLISCYPYLINDKRIVVFGDLVTEATSSSN
jgi:sortase A